jgi:hypothetical protein
MPEHLFLDIREHDEHLHQKLRPRVPEPDVPVSGPKRIDAF